MSKKAKYGYMCTTNWDWELGEALGGTAIYPSVDDLKRECKCVTHCGITKVKISFVKMVDPGKGFKSEENEA